MWHRQEPPGSIHRLLLVQSGVVTAAQCAGSGLGRGPLRRLVGTQWQTLARGVYYTTTAEPPWSAYACAGVLIGGEGSRLGGLSAATVHHLQDAESLPIEILVPGRLPTVPSWARFAGDRAAGRGGSTRGFPPSLNLVDTVLDLAARGSAEQAVGWITTAVQRGLTTPQALTKGVARRVRLRRRALIVAVIADAAQGVHSNLERRYLTDVERAHRLPAADRQLRPRGPTRYLDVAYREQRVLVELDGRLGHTSVADRAGDRQRDNTHSVADWPTLRYGWAEVSQDPCAVAAQVGGLLMDRGWVGPVQSCQRCPLGA